MKYTSNPGKAECLTASVLQGPAGSVDPSQVREEGVFVRGKAGTLLGR